MTKVVVDMSMSLDGFVAGPDDGKTFPLGRHGGMPRSGSGALTRSGLGAV